MTKEIQPDSPSLPQPKKGMLEWAPDYLEALKKAKGVLYAAAKLVNLSYSAVYKSRLAYPDFDKAVAEINAGQDSFDLAMLEEISLTQAMKPGNVTERIFRMKTYDPKYRDLRTVPGLGNIKITLGYHIPATPRTNIPVDTKIIDADVEEGPKTTGDGKMSILSDDEVEIDV